MTDTELVAAIRKIIRSKPRVKKADARSVEAADLARYDQIVGLLRRAGNGVEDRAEATTP